MYTIRVKSYWDWLPPEIQEYIDLLAQYQHAVDRVKEVWRLGHVKIVRYKCRWQGFCQFHNRYHTEFFLTYIDVYHRKKQWCLRNIDLSDLDVLLKRVAEEKNWN